VTVAAGSSLTASHTCVRYPASKSSGAPGPPIFVATQPGSRAFERTPDALRVGNTASNEPGLFF